MAHYSLESSSLRTTLVLARVVHKSWGGQLDPFVKHSLMNTQSQVADRGNTRTQAHAPLDTSWQKWRTRKRNGALPNVAQNV